MPKPKHLPPSEGRISHLHPAATARRHPAPSSSHGSGPRRPWLAPPPRARHLAGWALLPLRVFLGVTFCFAGLQKLANPGFFRSSNPASIQSQLAGAARYSPLHSLLVSLGHVAVPLGLLIAFGEVAVGLGTLFGLKARLAAAGDAAISFSLFLTVSFHSSPYYTGSDIVFFFAWLPLIAAGVGPIALDAWLPNLARRANGLEAETVVPIPFSKVRTVCGAYSEGACTARRGKPCEPGPCPFLAASRDRRHPARRADPDDPERRALLAAALTLGAVGLVGAGAVAGIGRLVGGGSAPSGQAPLRDASPPPSSANGSAGSPPTSSSSATSSPPATTEPAKTPPGKPIGPASSVPVGGAASFTDPSSGDPALVVQPESGAFLGFDATCPHAGCTVQYSSGQRLFICPCHGSEFNGRTGAVEVGPAQTGLTPITVAEGSNGQLYAV